MTGAWPVSTKIGNVWNALGGPSGVLGYPTTDPTSPVTVAENQGFQHGVVNISTSAEVYVGTYETISAAAPSATPAVQQAIVPPAPSAPSPGQRQEIGYDTSHIEGTAVNPLWPQYGTMVLRTGYYNEDIDDGWGYDKAYHKHNLQAVDSILFALRSPYTQDRSGGEEGRDFYTRARKMECNWASGECEEIDYRWVHAIYDPRKFDKYKGVPAGDPVGVVTAYCGDQNWCDPWVDVALTNPSNPN